MGRVGVYAEKLRKPISPVVVLCTFDVFAKVKEKLTTRKMSSEILTSALLFLFFNQPLMAVHTICHVFHSHLNESLAFLIVNKPHQILLTRT